MTLEPSFTSPSPPCLTWSASIWAFCMFSPFFWEDYCLSVSTVEPIPSPQLDVILILWASKTSHRFLQSCLIFYPNKTSHMMINSLLKTVAALGIFIFIFPAVLSQWLSHNRNSVLIFLISSILMHLNICVPAMC